MNKNTFPELLLRIGDFLKRNAVYIVGFFIIFIAVWRLRGTYEFAVTPNRGVKLAIYIFLLVLPPYALRWPKQKSCTSSFLL